MKAVSEKAEFQRMIAEWERRVTAARDELLAHLDMVLPNPSRPFYLVDGIRKLLGRPFELDRNHTAYQGRYFGYDSQLTGQIMRNAKEEAPEVKELIERLLKENHSSEYLRASAFQWSKVAPLDEGTKEVIAKAYGHIIDVVKARELGLDILPAQNRPVGPFSLRIGSRRPTAGEYRYFYGTGNPHMDPESGLRLLGIDNPYYASKDDIFNALADLMAQAEKVADPVFRKRLMDRLGQLDLGLHFDKNASHYLSNIVFEAELKSSSPIATKIYEILNSSKHPQELIYRLNSLRAQELSRAHRLDALSLRDIARLDQATFFARGYQIARWAEAHGAGDASKLLESWWARSIEVNQVQLPMTVSESEMWLTNALPKFGMKFDREIYLDSDKRIDFVNELIAKLFQQNSEFDRALVERTYKASLALERAYGMGPSSMEALVLSNQNSKFYLPFEWITDPEFAGNKRFFFSVFGETETVSDNMPAFLFGEGAAFQASEPGLMKSRLETSQINHQQRMDKIAETQSIQKRSQRDPATLGPRDSLIEQLIHRHNLAVQLGDNLSAQRLRKTLTERIGIKPEQRQRLFDIPVQQPQVATPRPGKPAAEAPSSEPSNSGLIIPGEERPRTPGGILLPTPEETKALGRQNPNILPPTKPELKKP
jgi:hypothetical protein